MGVFFEICKFSAGSLVWGFLISAVCMALFLIALKGWFKNAQLSPWTYVVGVVLFIFVGLQSTMISGAIKIIDTTDYYEQQLTEMVNRAQESRGEGFGLGDLVQTVLGGGGLSDVIGGIIGGILSGDPQKEISGPESTAIVENLVDQFPILSNYFNTGAFTGYTIQELPHAIAMEMKDYLKWYIFRRLLWCLGFLVVATIVAIKTMDRKGAYTRSATGGYAGGGTSGLSSFSDEAF